MAQTALYRKWRPQNFATIVGQTAIVTTLRNAVREQRTAHAYLFSGPRGTGKTSTARILAKALNCLDVRDGEPCNQCRMCEQITQGAELDVIEIDAASQTGVDNMRELTDKLDFVPLEVRVKVVIIDEVHMLSTASFNALLKTLEEPPGHAVFILATTEMHKVLPTIVSRCQRFEFKRITLNEQIEHLRYICQQEQIEITEDALQYLARLSDGGMRDALSLLDQTIAFAGRALTVSDFIEVTGGLQLDQYGRFFDALLEKNIPHILELVENWLRIGKNPSQMLHNLIEFFRDLLVFKLIPDSKHAPVLFAEPQWTERLEQFSVQRIHESLKTLSEFIAEMRYAAHPQTILELAIIKLCAGDEFRTSPSGHSEDVLALAQKIHSLENQVQHLENELSMLNAKWQQMSSADRRHSSGLSSGSSGGFGLERQPVVAVEFDSQKLQAFFSSQNSQLTKKYQLDWPKVMAKIKQESVSLHAWIKDGKPEAFLDDAVLLVFQSPIHCETTNKPPNKKMFESKLEEVYGHPLKIVAIQHAEWKKTVAQQTVEHAPQQAQSPEPLQLEQQSEQPGDDRPPWVAEAIELFGEQLVQLKTEKE